MRQLPRLTRLGILPDIGGRTDEITAQLTDPVRLRTARVHPVNVLVAQRTYASGRSARGAGTWVPSPKVTDALDAAFYQAFGAVEPAGTRTLLAVDVPGSMAASIARMPLSAREASAALALVQLATEPSATAVGFSVGVGAGWHDSALKPLDISPRRRLDDALRVIDEMPMSGTDCALPLLHAGKKQLEIDTFVVYTDNETWAGNVHPHQALADGGPVADRRVRSRTLIEAAVRPMAESALLPAVRRQRERQDMSAPDIRHGSGVRHACEQMTLDTAGRPKRDPGWRHG
jgi:60 kDa SS-A/Ro ribonucleoprotein